jgi:chromosome partitioning protein
MIIAITNTKGGSGKTTTAMLLAEAAGRAGHTAQVLDADPQGSATDWAQEAEDAGDPITRYAVTTVNRSSLRRIAERSEAEWIFIDTPPGDPATIDQAIQLADFVIVPTAPSPGDFYRTVSTIQSLGDTPLAVLLTISHSRRKKLHDQIIQLCDDMDLVRFETEIPNRVGIAESWFADTQKLDLAGYQDVYTELSTALRTHMQRA